MKKLLAFGIVAPILFLVLTITAGYIHQHYNHFTIAVNELGAVGIASQTYIASLLFSIGFYKASKALQLNILLALCSFAIFISFYRAAIFPVHNQLHRLLGSLLLFILLTTML